MRVELNEEISDIKVHQAAVNQTDWPFEHRPSRAYAQVRLILAHALRVAPDRLLAALRQFLLVRFELSGGGCMPSRGSL